MSKRKTLTATELNDAIHAYWVEGHNTQLRLGQYVLNFYLDVIDPDLYHDTDNNSAKSKLFERYLEKKYDTVQ